MIATKLHCLKCGDKVVSLHRHDFVYCSCGACAIDGGRDYTRTLGNYEDYELIEEEVTQEDHAAFNERHKLTPKQLEEYKDFLAKARLFY